FGDLCVKVLHMEMHFDVFYDHTIVKSDLHVRCLQDLEDLNLNAKNLEISEVMVDGQKAKYDYREKDFILKVEFGKKVLKGKKIVIHTETICRPTKHILEGLYYDETPDGCPPTQITQCQQWGFQRLVPCIDDMMAKCTYRTTIVANKKYTNLLSNGDPTSKIEKLSGGRAKITYANVITPMATYLFFLGVGTYATLRKEFIYPNGDSFWLELLVWKDSDKKIAMKALDVLHDAIMWIHLFTGEDKYKNWKKSLQIQNLCERRARGEKVQPQIDRLCRGMKFGYKYTGKVYREIAMQNSDFGGMENVGNTTITANRIMPYPDMTDGSFEYMVRVKVHEFYHNLNGSEVTGRSPFEIWLNEAVTVFIEQEYHEFLFGEEYCRLDSVLSFLAPASGTFAGDDNVASMPIEPDGFNDTNELITGVTYVKAPEFVKMIETLLGKEKFVKGLALYHRRYKHGNASRAQWIEAMEKVSGKNLQRMAQTWLKQASYPKIFAKLSYDEKAKQYMISLEQKGFKKGMHWEFPFSVAICDRNGKVIASETFVVSKPKETFVFANVRKPAFVSLNRNYSAFGKVFYDVSDEDLYLQVRKDSDMVNRYMAFYNLSEREKLKIIEGGHVSESFVDLYFEILSDEKLMEKVGTEILTIFEQVEDSRFAHEYQKLYDCVKSIGKAVAEKYGEKLLKMYKKYSSVKFKEGQYVQKEARAIKARQVKNAALALLAKLDNKKAWKLIKKQYKKAKCATDRIVAFSLYINSTAPDKMKVLQHYQKMASKNLVSWESFLSVVAGNSSDDCVEVMQKVLKSESFRIEQANDQRALFGRFSMNRKKSLLTAKGRAFMKAKILQLAKINEYNTGYMLKVFGNIDQIGIEHQAALVGVLMDVKKKLSADKTPSVYNTIERILKGSPKGMKRWKGGLK
ncbi:M1 family metallopeptidase, partial [Candidatus Peregrinibacteria bacterium]|nr:M1 family metallopeptidase [Candidatus Peregrinibacteria bacterium]